jgi:hypothetical protein
MPQTQGNFLPSCLGLFPSYFRNTGGDKSCLSDVPISRVKGQGSARSHHAIGR